MSNPIIHLIIILPFLFSKFSVLKFDIHKNRPEQQAEYFSDSLGYPQEKHLQNIRQLTESGDNAEAYFSFDGNKLIFQANNSYWHTSCDQIFFYDLQTSYDDQNPAPMLSTGAGRTTCSYFLPGDSTIIYASTHLSSSECPPEPERTVDGKYVWPMYPSFDIFTADLSGNIISQLTTTPGYDAEATVSPTGKKIVFTSMRSGDPELYTMNLDGSEVTQITDELGYDGGAFFSPDGEYLVFRASRPQTPEEIEAYSSLLAKNLVQPTEMELFVCKSDGSNLSQITNLGNANWAPFFHPSGQKIIFSSNHQSSRGFPFNLYMIDLNGDQLEQITFDPVFDSFPMFSPDGKKLVFASNRNNGGTRYTNLFIADWVD